jgi:hypothetical protein
MKTTLDIPDDLLADVTTIAKQAGRELNDVVVDGLRRVVASTPALAVQGNSRSRVHLPIIECGQPGTLNIPDNAAARLDIMEDAERHASSV